MRRLLTLSVAALGLLAARRPALAFDAPLVPSADTFINSAVPDNNDGASPSLYLGQNGQGGVMRALVRFAMRPEWQGRVMVTRVALTMTTRGTGITETTPPTEATASLQALSTAWTEGSGFGDSTMANTVGQPCGTTGATWNQPDCAGGTPWAGGSVAATVSGSAPVPATLEAAVTWSSDAPENAGMIADVQTWIDVPAANAGWRIASSTEATGSGQAQRFHAREDTGKGPTLTVTIACLSGFSEEAGRCVANRTPDAGTPDGGGTGSSGSGCSCSVADPVPGGLGLLLAAAGIGIARTRRRRRA